MMMNKAVLVRPINGRTCLWLDTQVATIRRNTGRRLGYGPLLEAIVNGIVEAGIDFTDCAGMSDVSAKMVRLLNARFTRTDLLQGGK
ncbi:hypothetical protein [uncultured Paludibaculum sp.]|uniref:hypothetical protein n=1 Tax=uncultured Paludibaculum sp. TaxID=1765020 RepID=UPI002AABE6C8|nr:hypothetical protein [uncultured Paludibaculum sp.]